MNHGQKQIDSHWDGHLLRAWRKKHGRGHENTAATLRVSVPSLYRYEDGYVPPIYVAHRVVAMTNGEIRYRDMYNSFRPEYA